MSAAVQRFCGAGEEVINRVAAALLEQIPHRRIITFSGELGAGKTTLIKALCGLLGVKEAVSSPTYALVNEYTTQSGLSVYHFDWYRIKDAQELLDIGIYEYLDGQGLCLIEWPSMAEALLEGEALLSVNITHEAEGRCYALSALGAA